MGILNADTRIIKTETMDEEKKILKCKEEIKKYNKQITDTQVK